MNWFIQKDAVLTLILWIPLFGSGCIPHFLLYDSNKICNIQLVTNFSEYSRSVYFKSYLYVEEVRLYILKFSFLNLRFFRKTFILLFFFVPYSSYHSRYKMLQERLFARLRSTKVDCIRKDDWLKNVKSALIGQKFSAVP